MGRVCLEMRKHQKGEFSVEADGVSKPLSPEQDKYITDLRQSSVAVAELELANLQEYILWCFCPSYIMHDALRTMLPTLVFLPLVYMHDALRTMLPTLVFLPLVYMHDALGRAI